MVSSSFHFDKRIINITPGSYIFYQYHESDQGIRFQQMKQLLHEEEALFKKVLFH